jgi:FkbM family methyltransferase
MSFILKSWVKLIVRKLVIWIPLNLQRFLFVRLAESLNVPLIQVNGSIGSILGSIHDELLYPYLGHTIATDVITSYIERFFLMNGNLGRFLDVGANIGLVTVPIAQNQSIQCKAFEPEPLNYQLLNWNINSNCRYHNVETYNIAVWRERATLGLELSAKDPGDHRIQGIQPNPERPKINVIGASLDEIVPSSWIQPPLVVKIDAQGSEVEIIRGGQATISKADLLVLEFWPTGISLFGSDLAWFFAYLGETFTRGASVPAGELNVRLEEASFRPIQDLVSELRVFVQKSLPAQQVDLFLRRN